MSLEELKTYRQQVKWLFKEYGYKVFRRDGTVDYTWLDFYWLRVFGGLPSLDPETFRILVTNIGKLQNVERASRKLREGEGNNLREEEYRKAIVRI